MTARPEIAGATRVVVKVGSSSLTTLPGGLDEQRLVALVDVLAALRAAGREVVLVSSGAIAAGLAPLGLDRKPPDLATAQAAASVGQLRLVQTYADAFARHGITVGQVLLTAEETAGLGGRGTDVRIDAPHRVRASERLAAKKARRVPYELSTDEGWTDEQLTALEGSEDDS